MPEVSMMNPEPSEVVLCGCKSPLPPGPPRRFLKKSSKNSSNGEPGGNFGIARHVLGFDGLRGRDVDHRVDHLLGDIGDAVGTAGKCRRRDHEAGGAEADRGQPGAQAMSQARDRSGHVESLCLETARNVTRTVRPNGAMAQASADISRPSARDKYGEKPARKLAAPVNLTLIPGRTNVRPNPA